MKKRILTIVVACFLATAFYLSASADIIDQCKLQFTNKVSPGMGVKVLFPLYPNGISTTAGVYHLNVEHYLGDPPDGYYGELLGFCVEGTAASTNNLFYDIWTIDDDGGGLEMAAWVADDYFSGTSTSLRAAAAQVAIWEAVYDPTNLDLSTGNFQLLNRLPGDSLYDAAKVLLTALESENWGAYSPGRWNVARRPLGDPPVEAAPQDYLVPNIPEPGTMLLLGTGLLGLYGYVRRKRSGKTVA